MQISRKSGSLINWRSAVGYLVLLASVAGVVIACLVARP